MSLDARRPAALVLAAATILLPAALSGCEKANEYKAPPPPEVTVSPPVVRSVTTYKEYTGTTKAFETVDLRARVKGFLKEKHYREGDVVKAGQLLLVIDEEPFQATFNQAQAKVAEAEASVEKARKSKAVEVAEAQVKLDVSQLDLAKIEEGRQRTLVSRNAATRQDFDKAEAERKGEAQVEADRASLEQAKADFDINILSTKASLALANAQLESARIDLSYCRVTSPVDGLISRNLANVGNLVGDGQSTVLATVLKDNPIYAYMTVSEADLLSFKGLVREGKRADYRKVDLPMEMGMSVEKGFPHQGKIQYADPGVDPGSGTVQARGIFENPDHAIVSGQFVRIRVPFQTLKDALLVPERALVVDPTGRFLLVVNDKNEVERRAVTVGSLTDDGMRVIESNLKAGEKVVVNGLQRARPGARVTPKAAPSRPSTSLAAATRP